MAITKSGQNYEDKKTGFFSYGEGAPGKLIVDGGHQLKLVATAAQSEPFLLIGGNDSGEVIVTGEGSRLLLEGKERRPKARGRLSRVRCPFGTAAPLPSRTILKRRSRAISPTASF